MLNMEEREIVKCYEGSREEVLDKLRAALSHVTPPSLALATKNAIRELESMSDADFSRIQS